MLNDDGLDTEDADLEQQSKDHVTMNDLMEALEVKYDLLREKLLLEMASNSAGNFHIFCIELLINLIQRFYLGWCLLTLAMSQIILNTLPRHYIR